MSLCALVALVAPAHSEVVEGAVRERGTGDPVPGAFVRVGLPGGDLQVIADARGRFELDLPAGTWTLVAGSDDHRPHETTLTVPADERVVLYLPPAEPPPEVVVEARRPSPHVSRQLLDQERVEKTPGTHTDPFRLMQALPGVAATAEYSPAAGDLAIRGSAPAESRIFVDGVEIPYLYHFQEYSSVIHTEVIDEVALYPSTFGAEYGNAVGGVAEVTTRTADAFTGTSRGRVHGGVNANFIMAGGYMASPVGERGAAAVSGRRSFLDLVEESNDQYTLWPIFWDYLGRYDFEPETGRRYALTLIGAGDRYGRYAGDTAELDPLEAAEAPSFDLDRAFHGAILREDRTTARARLGTALAVLTDDLEGTLPSDSQRRRESYLWLRHDGVYLIPDEAFQLATGIELKGTDLLRQADPGRAWVELEREAPMLAAGLPVDEQLTELLFGAWAEPRIKLGGTTIMPGVRLQGETSNGRTRLGLDPRIGVQSEFARDRRLHAAAGVYHQAPELDDLSPTTGDPTLGMVRSEQVALGGEVAVAGRWELGADAWGKTFHDVVVSEPGERPVAAEGWAAGVELTSRYRIRERFFSWVSLTLGHAERAGAPFDYDQPYAANFVASWDFAERWNAGMRYRYAAGMPYTPVADSIYDGDADSYLPILGDSNSVRLPDYQKVDFQIERELTFRTWTMGLYAAVWWVPKRSNFLYPVYSYDFTEQALVVGPPLVPLLGGRASF